MSRNPDLPEPYHPEAVALLRGRLAEAGGVSAELLARPDSAGWIAALAGHSPFLADLVAREPAILTRLLDRGADDAFQLAVAPLARADPASVRRLAPSLGLGAGCAALAGAVAARVLQQRPGRTAAGPALYRLALAAAVLRRVHTTGRDSW